MILSRQLLNSAGKLARGQKSTNQIITQLGYVQIDTISVINRAHHHILWTRNKNYKEAHLHDLQSKHKSIFEYWTHAMSYVPMEDYRFCLPKMESFRKPSTKWIKHRFEKSKKYFKPVLERIKNEFQLRSSDF